MDLFKGCKTYAKKVTRYHTLMSIKSLELQRLDIVFKQNKKKITLNRLLGDFILANSFVIQNKVIIEAHKKEKATYNRMKNKYNHLNQCSDNEKKYE